MAQAASLLPGLQYVVRSGLYEGEIVTIKDNKTFPDDHSLRRKVTILLPSGDETYILPRLLADQPVGSVTEMPEHNAATRTIQRRPVAADNSYVDEAPALPAPVQVQPVVSSRRVQQVVDPIVDPMDPRLDHFRPSPSKARRYVSREIGEGGDAVNDIEFLLTFASDGYRAENEGRPANIMLKGDSQSGKTFVVEVLAVEWAKQLGLPKPLPVFTLSGSSGITDYDLFGQTTSYSDENGERLVWLPGIVDLAARVGGILYLDEVNAMGERVTSSLHPLADHRHLFLNRNKAIEVGGQFMPETVVGSLDLWVIGTYNEGYRGMGEMNEAFINRFRHIQWDYDKAVEAKLVRSPSIRLLADRLRTARRSKHLRTPVGTSALQRLERDVSSFGPQVALAVFVGMFKDSKERSIVNEIINDGSVEIGLGEEIREAGRDSGNTDSDPDLF